MFSLKNKGETIRSVGDMSIIGLTLVIATVIGYLAGKWIGGLFGKPEWGMVIGVLFGATAGFREMFRTVMKYTREMEEEERKKREERK